MSSIVAPEIGPGRARLIGILCIVGAMVLFTVTDVSIKLLSGGYALHQIVLIRSLIGLVMLLGLILPLRGGYAVLRTRRLQLHALRGMLVVAANMLFFAALAVMPLADAVAISFVSPLAITVLSVLLLKESVGPRRWAAIAIGLLGVIVVLRPGTEAFQPAALLPFFGAIAYAFLNILTRKMGGTEQATTLTFYIQLSFIAVSLAMGLAVGDGRFAGAAGPAAEFLLRAWVWPAASDWPLLLVLGITSGIGSLLLSEAYRTCEAGMVAPFEYTAMPIAVVFGVLVFKEWPDPITWLGIVLIIGGGLYMLWRETRARPLPQTPQARR